MKRLVLAGAGHAHALVLRALVRQAMPGEQAVHGGLQPRGTRLLPRLAPAARRAAQRALDRAGVTVPFGSGWCTSVDQSSDVVIRTTGAEAHGGPQDPAQRDSLAVDERGFVRIDEQLRSVSHPQVFAAGDCASWSAQALPMAGVHAVRMGPGLASNLRAALKVPAAAGDLRVHRPQRHFLALLARGDGRAIASRGPFGAESAGAWRWKDRIDRRFLRQFELPHAASRPDHPFVSPADVPAPQPGETR